RRAPRWCGRGDSNPHDLHRWNLNPVRLPVSPRPRRAPTRAGSNTDAAAVNIPAPRCGLPRGPVQLLGTPREAADRGRGGDLAGAAIGLVVGLDVALAVEVVDHDPGRLLEPLLGDVAKPVEPLDARAVAQMEMRHRIARPPGPGAFVQQIAGAQPQERLA